MHDIWKDMFVMGLPLLEKVLRPIIVYAFLVISLRLSGKRELVQLNPFDLVVLLTLSNTVQNAIIGEDNSVLGGLIGATSLLVTNYLVVRFLYDHRKLDQLVEGRADVLIEAGKVRTKHLKTELITMAQLEAAARKQGFGSISDVEQCVLEPGGTLTFIGKKPGSEDVRHQELIGRLERARNPRHVLRYPSWSSTASCIRLHSPLCLRSGFSRHRLQRFMRRRKRAVYVRESMCRRDKRCFKL